MNSELHFIKQEALTLSVGESTKAYCPFCDNNPNYAPSLSITRGENGILYNCYRDSCSGRGMIGSIRNNTVCGTVPSFTPNPYTGYSRTPDKVDLAQLLNKYEITEKEVANHGIKSIEGGWLTPIYSSGGYMFGYTTKYFKSKLKAIHYLEEETCGLHYVIQTEALWTKPAILVEDTISGIRVGRFAHAIVLLGTVLNDKRVRDILNHYYADIVVALDPDAIDTAIRMKNKYSLFFNTFRIAVLSKDPKDLSHEQLKKELDL